MRRFAGKTNLFGVIAFATGVALFLLLYRQPASAGSVTSSPITCSGVACGTYYSVQLNVSCSWVNSASSCTGTDSVTPPSTGSDSVYVSQVVASGVPGTCQATGQKFLNTGSIFGISFSSYGGTGNITGTETGNTGSDTVTVSGGCIGGGGGMTGVYHLTDCHSGYTATGDGTCTPACALSSFTASSATAPATLVWIVSGTVNASTLSITQNSNSYLPFSGSLPATGNAQNVPAGTYMFNAPGCTGSPAGPIVISAPAASLGATWTAPSLPAGATYTISPDQKTETITVPAGTQPFSIPFNYFNNGQSGSVVNVTQCNSTNRSIAVPGACSGTLTAP